MENPLAIPDHFRIVSDSKKSANTLAATESCSSPNQNQSIGWNGLLVLPKIPGKTIGP